MAARESGHDGMEIDQGEMRTAEDVPVTSNI
jgi:hypothetical protein